MIGGSVLLAFGLTIAAGLSTGIGSAIAFFAVPQELAAELAEAVGQDVEHLRPRMVAA